MDVLGGKRLQWEGRSAEADLRGILRVTLAEPAGTYVRYRCPQKWPIPRGLTVDLPRNQRGAPRATTEHPRGAPDGRLEAAGDE